MTKTSASQLDGPGRKRLRMLLAVPTLLFGVVWAVYYLWPAIRESAWNRALTKRVFGPDGAAASRVVYPPSPYKNTRPGVSYVGAAACGRCHREIADDYRAHPMGRSLGLAADEAPGRPDIPAEGIAFEANGFRYRVERRDGRVFHSETRQGGDGRVLAAIEAEVRYALGSGARGVSYLVDHDGFLFQSPISWYSQEKRWDLAPGYRAENRHFTRTIKPGCLFCHSSGVDLVPGSENRYDTSTFQGHAIGCERCHGPGELHVKEPGPPGEIDLTIVNPAHLTPALRDSVCQQCHLQGVVRIVRDGHGSYEFRPGLPYQRFWAVFQKNDDGPRDFRGVGHVEQMESSRCFRESEGRLGCISCHDPHRLPPPSERVAFYRDRCLECHTVKGCTQPAPERQARGDDCAACHMPRGSLTNIAHTAATDHRIPRRPGAAAPGAVPSRPRAFPLVDHHEAVMSDSERQEARRDLGVALTIAGWAAMPSDPYASVSGTLAFPLLQEALARRPDDLTAREAEGTALRIQGKAEEALRVFESVVTADPRRERAMQLAASTAAELRRFDVARRGWERLIVIDPWRPEFHLALAQACDQLGDWPAAASECRDAIRLDPALLDARALLIRAYLRSREPDRARAEYQTLIGFAPAGRDAWQSWFEQQQREARNAEAR